MAWLLCEESRWHLGHLSKCRLPCLSFCVCKYCSWKQKIKFSCFYAPVGYNFTDCFLENAFGGLFMITPMVDDVSDLFKSSWLSSGQKVIVCVIKVQNSLILPAPLKNSSHSHEGAPFQELPCHPVQKYRRKISSFRAGGITVWRACIPLSMRMTPPFFVAFSLSLAFWNHLLNRNVNSLLRNLVLKTETCKNSEVFRILRY